MAIYNFDYLSSSWQKTVFFGEKFGKTKVSYLYLIDISNWMKNALILILFQAIIQINVI